MNIRLIECGELPTLVDELWLPFAEEMAALNPYNGLNDSIRDNALAYRREQYDDDDIRIWVAEEDAELVGYCVIKKETSPPVFKRGPRGYIEDVYVVPHHRRRGAGSALLKTAEAWALEHGCMHTELMVDANNQNARQLYEANGYTVNRKEMYKSLTPD